MQALENVNVVSLGQIYNGPYCALLLGFLGADVVKVEPPGGESVRSRDERGLTPEAIMLNSSKQSVTLDLKDDRGKELFKDLVRDADVLVENYKVGTMDGLGLGYETLSSINPELVYAHGSGYGESGAYTDYPAMDLTIQAMGGIMDVTGFPDAPPVKAGAQIADFMGGIHLLSAVLAALYQREVTGEGQFVEAAMMEAVYPTLMSPMAAHYRAPELPHRTGNRHSGMAVSPYNVYEAEDGYIAVICVNEPHWERLTEVMGRPELGTHEDYNTNEKRKDRMDEVDAIVEAWTIEQGRDEVAEILLDAGVPCAPVKDREEVLYDEHLAEREMVNEIEHPEFGTIRVPGLPMKLEHSEAPDIEPAQRAGGANEAVYRSLGLTAEEIAELEADGVI